MRVNPMKHLAMLILALAPAADTLTAQAPADSIAAWTQALRDGSAGQRSHAASMLAAQDPGSLPPATRQVIVAELRRVNDARLNRRPLQGLAELDGETMVEYYLDLAVPAAHFGDPEARLATVHSVGVSRGHQRRAARLGDAAVPVLADMIAKGYQAQDALEAMGLAWFWADSTGATLSDPSRRQILEAFTNALGSGDFGIRLGLADALDLSREPAFLPLAEELLRRETERRRQVRVPTVRPGLETRTLPTLRTAVAQLRPDELAQGTLQLVEIVCEGATHGARRGTCEALQHDLATARQLLERDSADPARNVLEAAANRADHALSTGVLTPEEHALIAGGIRTIIARL
jgi:hypothetical protein